MNVVQKLKNFSAHPFLYDSAILQIGSVAGTIVQAIAGVVLARMLGPHEFGRFAIVMSLAAIGSIFLGAGASDAMAPVVSRAHHGSDEHEMRHALLFLGRFVVIASLIVGVIGFTLPSIAAHFYGDALLGWLAFAVLMASAVSTLIFVPTQLGLQVTGNIKKLSLLTFTDQASRQFFVVSFSFAGFGIVGAAAGHLVGALLVAGIARAFWVNLRATHNSLPKIGELLSSPSQGTERYLRSTLWVLADRNLAMLYSAAPIAIAGLYLSTTDISYFKIALGWVTLALSVLSPVSVLLNTELARIQLQNPNILRKRFLQISFAAVGASTLLAFIAALIAHPVFSILYGVTYRDAAGLVYWFIPFGAVMGFGIALGPLWRALNRVKISIIINFCVLVLSAPLTIIALQRWGSLGAVAMVTGWYALSHLTSFAYLAWTLQFSAVSQRG